MLPKTFYLLIYSYIGRFTTKAMTAEDHDGLPMNKDGSDNESSLRQGVDEQYVVGRCGTGNSHLAQALGHLAARQGHDVLFTTQTHLLNSLRQAQAVGSFERRFQALVQVPLLIIDDFGLKPLRPPEDETFHDLVAERYERTATLLTSNLDFGEWGDAFPANKMLGAATLDRLRHGAYRLILDGESYRRLKPLSSPAPTPVAKGAKNSHS